MKAVRFHDNRDIRVEDVAAPQRSLKPHDVLIKPIVCGICGTDHARTLATQVPGAELRIICDADATRAAALAAELEGVSVSTDPLATIADKAIDAVIVAAPDAMHEELIFAARAAANAPGR